MWIPPGREFELKFGFFRGLSLRLAQYFPCNAPGRLSAGRRCRADQTTLTTTGRGCGGQEVAVDAPKLGMKMFNFDKVFAPDSTQQQVYQDMQPLIRCVLDGYNVAVLAYGQTGSGKVRATRCRGAHCKRRRVGGEHADA